MDAADASAHYNQGTIEDKPSLLVVILDTNPYAWQELQDNLPLHVALAHILLFLNSHLAFSHANRVAVIASHTREAVFLYPNSTESESANGTSPRNDGASDPSRHANKYRLFGQIEDEVQRSFRRLLRDTSAEALHDTNETMMSGALSLALAYINRVCHVNNIDQGATAPRPGEIPTTDNIFMTARILVISVSGDLANQYVSVMNSIFAAQRQRVPIDICKIAGDTVFLQQASDSTHGIYMQLQHPESLLQYLLSCFMSDSSTRRHLIPPSQINVDFRAACFCHKKVVDIGFVCSICLSSLCPSPYELRPLEAIVQWRQCVLGEPCKVTRTKLLHERELLEGAQHAVISEDVMSDGFLSDEARARIQWWQDIDYYEIDLVANDESYRQKDSLQRMFPQLFPPKGRKRKHG